MPPFSVSPPPFEPDVVAGKALVPDAAEVGATELGVAAGMVVDAERAAAGLASVSGAVEEAGAVARGVVEGAEEGVAAVLDAEEEAARPGSGRKRPALGGLKEARRQRSAP